ncbi:MAG: hypothetical protein DYH14_09110 [Betaproteobacteria bacterium PRO3]|nr:hypothetical protein [Betaproteobacteria bacterium PRO3]
MTPTAHPDPIARRLRALRRAAQRFLIERGRPARTVDADRYLLAYWWRLDDEVHDRLDAIDRRRRTARC